MMSMICLLQSVLADPTHQTYSSLLSDYSLGKQDQLLETFSKLQSNISIPKVQYSPKFGQTYIIDNFSLTFNYQDAAQRSEFVEMDVIRISGGKVRLEYHFNFQKKQIGSTIKGNASGLVLSDQLIFQKMIQLTPTEQPRWDLKSYSPFSITNLLNIQRMDPPQADQDIYLALLNDIKDITSVRDRILALMQSLYAPTLNSSLHNQIFHYDHSLVYTFRPEVKKPQQINFTLNLNLIYLDKSGLSLCYSMNISDFKDFQYGQNVPSSLLDPSKYGGVQNFYSFKLFQSTLFYAISKNWFDSDLTRVNWGDAYFSFYAGDLMEIIDLGGKFKPNQQISGSCQVNSQGRYLSASNRTYLIAGLSYTCSIGIKSNGSLVGVLNFKPQLQFVVKVSALSTQLVMQVSKVNLIGVTYDSGQYLFKNKNLADFYLNTTLQLMVGKSVFGTGFPITKRSQPNVLVQDNYIFVYDSKLTQDS